MADLLFLKTPEKEYQSTTLIKKKIDTNSLPLKGIVKTRDGRSERSSKRPSLVVFYSFHTAYKNRM